MVSAERHTASTNETIVPEKSDQEKRHHRLQQMPEIISHTEFPKTGSSPRGWWPGLGRATGQVTPKGWQPERAGSQAAN